MTSTVRTVVATAFGGPEVLAEVDTPAPQPGADQVLVDVEASDVGLWDVKVRTGDPVMTGGAAPPVPLGWGVAGRVAALGAEVVGRLREGERVLAYVPGGATYAEQAVVPAAAVAVLPEGVSFLVGAALTVSGTAAYQGLVEALGMTAGHTLLVSGGAGGTGVLAVQLAKAAGARVLVTASPANHDALRALGADEAHDYAAGDEVERVRAAHPGGVDALLATIDGVLPARAVRPGGRAAAAAGLPADPSVPDGVELVPVYGRPDPVTLDALTARVASGALRVPLHAAYPLARAADAQRDLVTKHRPGKVLLAVGAAATREAADLGLLHP